MAGSAQRVRLDHRGSAVMMAQIFKVAKDNDCSRVEWTTDDDNAEAQCFYEKLGVTANL